MKSLDKIRQKCIIQKNDHSNLILTKGHGGLYKLETKKKNKISVIIILVAMFFSFVSGVAKAQSDTVVTAFRTTSDSISLYYHEMIIGYRDSVAILVLHKKVMNNRKEDTVVASIYNVNFSITKDDVTKVIAIGPWDSVAFGVVKRKIIKEPETLKDNKKNLLKNDDKEEFDIINIPKLDQDSDYHYRPPVKPYFSVAASFQRTLTVSIGIYVGGPTKAQWRYLKKLKGENDSGAVRFMTPMSLSLTWSYPTWSYPISVSSSTLNHTAIGFSYELYLGKNGWFSIGLDGLLAYNHVIYIQLFPNGSGPSTVHSYSWDNKKYALSPSIGFRIPMGYYCKMGIKLNPFFWGAWEIQNNGRCKIWSRYLDVGVNLQF